MAALPPAITSHPRSVLFRQRWRDPGFLFRLTFAADGGARPKSGGTPFRQPCPAYPSTIGRKAPQEHFSEESFRTFTSIRKRTFQPLHCKHSAITTPQKYSQHTASLDVLAEPNYYSKCARTSSTRVFASHSPTDMSGDYDRDERIIHSGRERSESSP